MSRDDGRPACQHYLVTPPVAHIDAARSLLPALLAQFDADPAASSLLLRAGTDDPAVIGAITDIIRSPVQERGIAVVLAGDPVLAARLELDGAHIPTGPSGIKAARTALGGDRILGVDCGFSRHAAMLAGEQGADYVTFGPFFIDGVDADEPHDPNDLSLLGWWQDMMELPCVARAAADETQRDALYDAGADFVMIPLAPATGA